LSRLGHDSRNNRVIEEIKQLSKIKQENTKSFEFKPGMVLIHKYSDFLKDDVLYDGELRIDGKLAYQIKGSKKQVTEIDLSNLSIWVEHRPTDENRTKATTANYLRWIEDPRVDNCNYRVCIESERDLIIRNCVRT
jgi:hypothetical protein